MSFSKPRLKNPAEFFVQFNAKTGQFSYWDKEAKDGDGDRIVIPLPIKFIVLDELTTITGYNQPRKMGIYSNEINNFNKQKLNVRFFKGDTIAKGYYDEIKDKVRGEKGSYTKSIYVLLIGDKRKVMANFQLSGAALGGWIEKKFDVEMFGVICEKIEEKTEGAIEFMVPVFEKRRISDEDRKLAIKMDTILQEYLKEYLKESQTNIEEEDIPQGEKEKARELKPTISEENNASYPEAVDVREQGIAEAEVIEDDLPF